VAGARAGAGGACPAAERTRTRQDPPVDAAAGVDRSECDSKMHKNSEIGQGAEPWVVPLPFCI